MRLTEERIPFPERLPLRRENFEFNPARGEAENGEV